MLDAGWRFHMFSLPKVGYPSRCWEFMHQNIGKSTGVSSNPNGGTEKNYGARLVIKPEVRKSVPYFSTRPHIAERSIPICEPQPHTYIFKCNCVIYIRSIRVYTHNICVLYALALIICYMYIFTLFTLDTLWYIIYYIILYYLILYYIILYYIELFWLFIYIILYCIL